MLEKKLQNAMAERDFVEYCLKTREAQMDELKPDYGPHTFYVELKGHIGDLKLQKSPYDELNDELKEHIGDLKLQKSLYEHYIRSLINEINLSEEGLVSNGTRTWEEIEREIKEFNCKIKERFNKYLHLKHLEDSYKR